MMARALPELDVQSTFPDAGIFAGIDNTDCDVVDLLTLLFTMPGFPPGRQDLERLRLPTKEEIAAMAARAEKNLTERVQTSPEARALVDASFSGGAEARRPALCVMLYTMDYTVPEPKPINVHQWVNAWLNVTVRNTPEIQAHIGPFFVEYNKAVKLLPEVTAKASRVMQVRAENCPQLEAAYRDYEAVFKHGRPVHFWGIASFTRDDAAIRTFARPKTADAKVIVFTCPAVQGRQLSLLSAFPGEAEIQPLTPSKFKVFSANRMPDGLLVVALEHEPALEVSRYEQQPTPPVAIHAEAPAVNHVAARPTMAKSHSRMMGWCWIVSGVVIALVATAVGLSSSSGTTTPAASHNGQVTSGPQETTLPPRNASGANSNETPTARTVSGAVTDSVSDRKPGLPLDKAVARKRLPHLEAIFLDGDSPATAPAYNDLAATMSAGEEVTLLDEKTVMSKRELYVKAISLDGDAPFMGPAYTNLANTLSAGEEVKLLDGTVMSERDLYVKAVSLDGELLAKIHACKTLAAMLSAGEKVKLLDGTVMGKRDLYVKAISFDPHSPFLGPVYNNLANTLAAGETVQLLDGKVVGKRDLYVKGISLDGDSPAKIYSCCNLAATLSDGETVTLLDGTVMSARDLIIKAISFDDNSLTMGSVYNSLANTLAAGETVKLLDGEIVGKHDLFLKTISLDGKSPAKVHACNDLAAALSDGETVTLLDGTVMSARGLFLKAISFGENPLTMGPAYNNLANTLAAGETVKLLDGEVVGKRELLIKAISPALHSPLMAPAYKNLAHTLSAGEEVMLGGKLMGKRELFLKARSLGRN